MFKKYFPYAVIATIVTTLLLIFIGGLVRASGAGLGCPDWPKCFGLLIPPTSVADLPAGFDPDSFNAVHTWTEFINRLFGALVGLFTLITAIFSTAYFKERKNITLVSWLVLIMVLFQAWLGGQVVLSALEQSMITIHLFVAMLIFATLVFLGWQTLKHNYTFSISQKQKRTLFWIAFPLALFTAIQILLGSQVREALDAVDQTVARSMWLEQVGLIDDIHRTFSWSIMLFSVGLVYFARKNELDIKITKLSYIALGLVLLQVLIGVVLAYGGLPKAFQVLHLGVSSMLLIPMFTLVFISVDSKV
jgi:cytochrome c oxidase assembly protein subunit 15